MSHNGDLFGDLLKIGGGDVSPVAERIQEFRVFADTIPASVHPSSGPHANSDLASEAQHYAP